MRGGVDVRWTSGRLKPWLSSAQYWSLAAGGVFAVAALAVSELVVAATFGDGVGPRSLGGSLLPLPLTATVGSFLLGWSLWALLVERPGGAGATRGALVGTVTAVLAHPLMWVLSAFPLAVVESLLVAGKATSSGAIWYLVLLPLSVVGTLLGSLTLSFWSLLFFGWATVPVGTLVGVGLGVLRGRSLTPATEDD